MGIKKILQYLPREEKKKFATLSRAARRNEPVDLDCGGLIYSCILHHKDEYNSGNFVPAAKEFYRKSVYYYHILQWDVQFVLDGPSPPEKHHEHERRRRSNEDRIVVSSTFIAMCAAILQKHLIPYVVAPQEADMQLKRQRRNAIIVCGDADALGYGASYVILVSQWGNEVCGIFDMTLALTAELAAEYPLYAFIRKHGIKIIHWWAAVNGCDVSVDGCGLKDIGAKAFLNAIKSVDEAGITDISRPLFASEILKCAKSSAVLRHSVESITAEFERVEKWYTESGTYYDTDGNVMSLPGQMLERASLGTTDHMRGRVDPKTKEAYTEEQRKCIEAVAVHNLLHSSAEDQSKICGIALPEGRSNVDECTKAEIKKMLLARGASLAGKDGKEMRVANMKERLKCFRYLEQMRPSQTVYFDRTRSNGIFSKIDTGHKSSTGSILQKLVRSSDHDRCGYSEFFADVLDMYVKGRFTDDFDTIASKSPEIDADTIYQEFMHIGNGKKSKNVSKSLKRVIEMNDLLYYAVAWGTDGESFYILSKQQASQRHDENTRNMTDAGERPLRKEYLVMLKLQVKKTDVEKVGHSLGLFVRVLKSYCALCSTGHGLCLHRGMALWTQYNHWGEDRPTPRPTTVSACPWIPGRLGKRSCRVTEPATNLMIEKLPDLPDEYEGREERRRKINMHYGHSSQYDIYGDEEKRNRLNDPAYTAPERMERLFKCLKNAQLK